jgi:hypothetical protein
VNEHVLRGIETNAQHMQRGWARDKAIPELLAEVRRMRKLVERIAKHVKTGRRSGEGLGPDYIDEGTIVVLEDLCKEALR